MQNAGQQNPGTMAAIIGMADEALDSLLQEAGACGIVQAANFNSPGQIVISETTYEAVKPYFEFEELPPAQVKGKEKALRIFNVLRANGVLPERQSSPA